MAGTTPTNDELETAIVNAGNLGYEKGKKVEFSNITSISATINGAKDSPDYYGVVNLEFTNKNQHNKNLESIKKENDINLENQKLIEKITNLEKENEKLQIKKDIKEEIIKDIKSTTIIIPKKEIKSKQEIIKNNEINPEIKEEKENK